MAGPLSEIRSFAAVAAALDALDRRIGQPARAFCHSWGRYRSRAPGSAPWCTIAGRRGQRARGYYAGSLHPDCLHHIRVDADRQRNRTRKLRRPDFNRSAARDCCDYRFLHCPAAGDVPFYWRYHLTAGEIAKLAFSRAWRRDPGSNHSNIVLPAAWRDWLLCLDDGFAGSWLG